ncbi:WAT1-related protein [Platanthera zijinensis]|uniref:WAT1-related protein n=1 Tax=Platanthera zijinensis TaxID=2320716 RepID=A0AAP0BPF3_9ASPA
MTAVSAAFAVMNVLVKAAIDGGMNHLLLITLRQLVATLFMAPAAYFFERTCGVKPTAVVIVWIFFSALLGVSLTQYLFFIGLQHTSATFACAFLNMVPVMTFLMALPFRVEKVNLKSKAGMTKILGAMVCIAGAVLLTLYKGSAIVSPVSHHPRFATQRLEPAAAVHIRTWKLWILGSMALFGACSSWSSWFLIQSKITKIYPALYTGTTIMFFQSFLQVLVLSFAVQRSSPAVWVLRSNMEIAAVLYSGVVGSGICAVASSWCIKRNGPVFAAAFSPLTQIIVGAFDFYILGEPLHLGSVLGSILVVVGLYFLLWGKSKEAHVTELKQIIAMENKDANEKV